MSMDMKGLLITLGMMVGTFLFAFLTTWFLST